MSQWSLNSPGGVRTSELTHPTIQWRLQRGRILDLIYHGTLQQGYDNTIGNVP